MVKISKIAFYGITLGFITACGTPQPLDSIRDRVGDIEAIYPAVSLWYADGSPEFEQECRDYDQASAFHYCSINSPYMVGDWLAEQLKTTYQFQYVGAYEENFDYQLHLTTANYSNENAGDYAGAIVSGVSLLLVPMKETYLQKSEVRVMWRDLELARFDYEFSIENSIGLFSDTSAADKDGGTEIAVALLHDLADSPAFEAEYLYQQLDASDYHNQLQKPEVIGDFYYEDMALIPDPLYGTQIRYVHPLFNFDYIDVFVYPIHSTDWSDLPTTLDEEIESFRYEMDNAVAQEAYASVELAEAEPINWQSPTGEELVGRKVIGSMTLNDGDIYDTYMYLFSQGDKLIKFRSSFLRSENPPPEIEEDILQALAEFSVPEESAYMQQVRANAQRQEKKR